jgi:arylsulfatase A-like enzyme
MSKLTSFTLASLLLAPLAALHAAPAAQRPVNLLFIMTDQQRWDAMSCAGNPVIKTPNMDRIAREGARFTSFYSSCPVCVPARSVILTGHSIESNHVLTNNDADRTDAPPFPSFDQILLRNGYRGEYHGKYHSPYHLTLDYTQPVRWLNGKKAPPGCKAESSESEAFFTFVEKNAPSRPVQDGQLTSRAGSYTPIPLDESYGKSSVVKPSQAGMYGRLDVPASVSHTTFTAQEGLAALDRLKGGPFTLTISLDPPHPPMLVSEPYYSLYPPASIPVPASLNDPRTNSPYPIPKKGDELAYRDATNIRQMTSIYYGMVTEVDEWVGKILQRLDELGLAKDTLVIFTSDHGEMLGDHGMHGKGYFYEGSAHVPLLMRLPGVIPASTVVPAPASQLDLFATILNYCGQPGHASEGRSLRPLMEGKENNTGRVAVSEWSSQGIPGFMLFDGRWKLMCGRSTDAPSLDALYDLKNDPQELNNLIGRNPDKEQYRAEAMRLKGLLIDWLTRVKSPHLDAVRNRPLFADGQLPKTVRKQK